MLGSGAVRVGVRIGADGSMQSGSGGSALGVEQKPAGSASAGSASATGGAAAPAAAEDYWARFSGSGNRLS